MLNIVLFVSNMAFCKCNVFHGRDRTRNTGFITCRVCLEDFQTAITCILLFVAPVIQWEGAWPLDLTCSSGQSSQQIDNAVHLLIHVDLYYKEVFTLFRRFCAFIKSYLYKQYARGATESYVWVVNLVCVYYEDCNVVW